MYCGLKTPKAHIIALLAEDFREKRISAVEHDKAYKMLIEAEDGHNFLWYAELVCSWLKC